MAIPTGAQPILADQALLLVKTETTPGTDAAPTALANALLCRSCSIKPIINMIELTRYGHNFRSPGAIPGQSHFEFEVEVPLVAPVVNTAHQSAPEPPWSPLLKISGFTATGQKDAVGSSDYHAAVMSDLKQPFSLVDGQTITISTDGAADETVTFNTADAADLGAMTAAEAVVVFNTDLTAATAVAWRGRIILHTDTLDNTGSIEVTGGTGIAAFNFPTGEVAAYTIVNRWVYTQSSNNCAQTATLHFCFFHACSETDNEYWLARVLGAAASVEFSFSQDEEAVAKFTGKGAWGEIGTGVYATLLGSGVRYLGFDDAMVAVGASVEFDRYEGGATRTDVFSQMSINMNWDVNERKDMTQTRGVRAFYITRKNSVTGSYDPEELVTATYNRWADVFAATPMGLVAIFESPQGSRLTLSAPNVQLGNPTMNMDGLLRHDQPFYLRDNSEAGDDAVALTFEPQP